MKRIKVWVDTDWSPGGVNWDLQSKGMARVYAEKGMSDWTPATLIIEQAPRKKKSTAKKLDK